MTLEREGMVLEVTDAANALVAELFYFCDDESITLTAHRPDIPLPVLEWMNKTDPHRNACKRQKNKVQEILGA